jgi:hypothetical protein
MRNLLLALSLSLTAAVAPAADITVSHGGKAAVGLTIPEGWTAIAVEAKTSIKTQQKHPHIQVWATAAADLAAAQKDVAKIVESEVTHFVAEKTQELTVGGAKAIALIGTGEEADDGDPSQAEVSFFTVGKVVYVMIAHGEGDGAAKQQAVLRGILASAKAL